MDWVRNVAGESVPGVPLDWLALAALGALLALLAAAELARPLRTPGGEAHGRLITNFALGIVNALLAAALPVSAVLAASWARSHGFGAMPWLGLGGAWSVVATLLVWSLAIYGLHVVAHRAPLLWRCHRVHHADTEVDLSTGFRHHPVEALYTSLLLSALAVLLGLEPAAVAAYALVAAAFAFWTHANLRLPDRMDAALRLLLVTPAVHHVHHSAARDETDRNYGDVLMLWDRLFGTYAGVPQPALTAMRIGLGPAYDEGAASLARQLALPFRSDPAPAAAPR